MALYFPERDQALLNALAKQAIRAPIPMIFVALIVAGLAWGKVPVVYILLWAAFVIAMQVARFKIIRALAIDTVKPPAARLRYATFLSFANGLVLASSIGFFTSLDDTSRAIYSMIMIGIVAGTIATSHGYRPIFIGFVLPILGSVSMAWLITAADTLSFIQTFGIAILTTALGALLYVSSKDVYRSFGDSFEVRKELEVALASEKSANAAKTRFLAAASHDLRQPLHAMSMLSAALTLQELNPKSKAIADKMNSAMTDLSSELDSLLDISKLDAGVMRVRPKKLSAGHLILKVVELYREPAARKNLKIELNIQEPIEIEVDSSLIERVLRNLLDNAIKYTEEGSVVVNCRTAGELCEITITDTGIGIPEDEQLKVREEFYQLSNTERDRQKGLGLGLSIVWRIVPLLGATLRMNSTLGTGTSYTLTLPLCKSSEHPKQQISDVINLKPLVSSLQGRHALVVEDDKDVRLGTRTLLEECGFKVSEATGTQDAIRVLKETTIDIALVDLRLPDGDNGFKTLEALRSMNTNLPVIIVSGETSTEVLQKAVAANCELIVKPVQMTDLIKEIHYALFSKKYSDVL